MDWISKKGKCEDMDRRKRVIFMIHLINLKNNLKTRKYIH